MRLLVYNIAYGTGSPRTTLELLGNAPRYLRTPERYFAAIVHLVRHFSPDVAGLLEIDNGSFRTRGVSQTARLAELLQSDPEKRFFSKYAPGSYLARLPYCRHQTNALLVRNALAEAEWVDFMPCGAKRLILGCQYEGITILLVHLALTYQVRQRQLEHLAKLVLGKEKVIVCGFLHRGDAVFCAGFPQEMRPHFLFALPKRLHLQMQPKDVKLKRLWICLAMNSI